MVLGSGNHRPKGIFRIILPQRAQADVLLLLRMGKGQMCATPDSVALPPQQLQQRFKALRLLPQGIVNGKAQLLPVGGFGPISQPLVVALTALGILHHRKPVLQTDHIAEPGHRPAGTQEVSCKCQ